MIRPTLNVYARSKLVEPAELAGATAVVIDVLRAGTTIVYALAAGAEQVVPCLEVADARAMVEQFPAGTALLGGERQGLPIEGFDLGNSPGEYEPARVAGKTIVLTTTNGTRAMASAREAETVVIAAFVNASAVARQLADKQHVAIVCAGTDGQIGNDDVLLAGLLVERLQRAGAMAYRHNSQAMTARETWLHAFGLPQALGAEPLAAERLAAELRKSQGGQNLIGLGLDDDILAAAHLDRFDIVPRLDPKTQRIRNDQ